MFMNPDYTLNLSTERRLLAALLLGLKPDGVLLILRANINSWIQKYEKAGAAFIIHYENEKNPAKTIHVMCVNTGSLDRVDLERLETLEFLYNTIDKWGWKDETQKNGNTRYISPTMG